MLILNKVEKAFSKIKNEPYLIINIIFVLVILMVFGYSLIFSPDANNYPVQCVHELLTGEPCVSCGLSHSFSLILLGRYEEALDWNPYGVRIFLFFAVQLLMRVVTSVIFLLWPRIARSLLLTDVVFSVGLVLYSFRPFLAYIF